MTGDFGGGARDPRIGWFAMKWIALVLCLWVVGCGDDDRPTDAAVSPDVPAERDAEVDAAPGDAGDDATAADASPGDAGADAAVADAGDDAPTPDAGDDAAVEQDAGPPLVCMRTGCSRQVCSDMDVITTCEIRPWYVCFDSATCEEQPGRTCGWTPTPELMRCLEENGAPDGL